MAKFKKITIIGVGLLGGSIGMAIKEKKLAQEVCGFFRNKIKIKKAMALKAVDYGTDDMGEAVQKADLIILATPVSDIINKLKWMKTNNIISLITDIGSTKRDIIKAAEGLNFIGSHPLTGSEQSGIEHAQSSIINNSISILTPISQKEQECSLKKIKFFWQQLGAKTTVLSAKTHDQLLAYSSHLPHALACTLIQSIPDKNFLYSAGGLKDTTRIALAETTMWIDIFLSNKKEVLGAISTFEKKLAYFKTALQGKNKPKLSSFLKKARTKRAKLSNLSKNTACGQL